MTRVKVCGITTLEDALTATRLGADALGFIFADSPRRVDPERAREIIRLLPPFVTRVGVFVNESMERIREIKDFCGLNLAQLHGDESESTVAGLGIRIVKTVKVRPDLPFPLDAFLGITLLLDTYSPTTHGGTGRTFDWRIARSVAQKRPIILAGGLTPENITEAIHTVHPYAVDVSSGVESQPGRKDHDKLERFIRRAKRVS